MLATLDRTDELLLVCSLDVPTLKNVRLALGTLAMLSFPTARVRIVLNFADSKVGMRRREVEAALDHKIAFEIPCDRSVPLAINKGAPAVLTDSGTDFARSIGVLAKGIFPTTQPKRSWKLRPSLARA
jgi:pilus assembly protein CpaE